MTKREKKCPIAEKYFGFDGRCHFRRTATDARRPPHHGTGSTNASHEINNAEKMDFIFKPLNDLLEKEHSRSCGLTESSDHPRRKRETCHVTQFIEVTRFCMPININLTRRMNVHLNVQRSGVPGWALSRSEFRQHKREASTLFGRTASFEISANGKGGQELDARIAHSQPSCRFLLTRRSGRACRSPGNALRQAQGERLYQFAGLIAGSNHLFALQRDTCAI